MTDPDTLLATARAVAPRCDFWSLRVVTERSESLRVRQDLVLPPSRSLDHGAMVTVVRGGGIGHAATGDLAAGGLRQAFETAAALADAMADRGVFRFEADTLPSPRGRHDGAFRQPLPATLAERLDLLRTACASLKTDPRIVDWSADLRSADTEQWLITAAGGIAVQRLHHTVPNLTAVAQAGEQTQTRTSGGQYNGFCRQGGLEVLQASGLLSDGPRVAEEAIALALAPNCPTGELDVLLMPDQMILQIHESIGHPLELDRILGDERNFAGTSFVTPDLFGHYRYGSDCLNVVVNPEPRDAFASFGFDDDGTPARRTRVIERGILLRPLGGTVSMARARAAGTAPAWADAPLAVSRASSWNRAPIDRMSNLDIEPGDASLAALVGGIDDGVLMRTNCSWSIDDSRNKFQFGCELGQRIRHGRLAEIVRNPNYRGVSATFWRSLARVGDASTMTALGTPYCGKGEPMQVVRVGHTSPACAFSRVAVFGAAR